MRAAQIAQQSAELQPGVTAARRFIRGRNNIREACLVHRPASLADYAPSYVRIYWLAKPGRYASAGYGRCRKPTDETPIRIVYRGRQDLFGPGAKHRAGEPVKDVSRYNQYSANAIVEN